MRRRPGLSLLLLPALSACQTWHRSPVPSPAAQQVPSTVRVTLADDGPVVVWHAAVEGDSLIGLVGEQPGQRRRFTVHLSQVRRMDARGPDFVATVAVSALATLAAVYAILATIGPAT